ncbi:MAG: hypothetical protein JSW17_04840 [Candidatus Omnitrophota bacterium]|nr:MAG: hypothetical protein JSW17_04840 [Candidatus Omnitrophota bacterium]
MLSVCFAPNGISFARDLIELRTDHFIIQYHPDIKHEYVRKVKNMCEELYRKITQEFKLVRDELWLWENRAQVFIAKDRDDYLNRFECPPWSSACVNYHGKLIYTYPGQKNISSMFAHELAHIIFREYAGWGRLPLWLDEAIAMYIEDKYNTTSYRNQLRILKRLISTDSYIALSELGELSAPELQGKSEDYVKRFYLESFSIVHFLIKRYGRDRFSRFLFFLRTGDDFEKSLSKGFHPLRNMNDLERQWKRFYQK